MPTIDVAPFMQVIEEAFRFAYFTVLGIAFGLALYAMISILVALWTGGIDE